MAMRSRLLEGYSRLNVVLVLCVGVKNIAFLLSITVSTAAVSVDALNCGGAITKSLAGLTCLITLDGLTTTVETLLEVSNIDNTWNRDIESSETICAH